MTDRILSDDEIISAMMEDGGYRSVSYVIRNRLRPIKIVNTDQVLAKLKSMETSGMVVRRPRQTRTGMIEWDVSAAIRSRS